MTEQSTQTGQCALVAGGSGGIGMAVARALAAEGCELHLAGPDEDRLDDAVETIGEDFGVEVEAHFTDLGSSINAAALGLECEDAGILINAFGEAPKGTGGIIDLEDDDWRAGFEMKVFGTINLCREMFEALGENGGETGGGVIVNVGCPPTGNICADTVNAAMRTFSESLDGDGVRVLFYQPSREMNDAENADAIVVLVLGHFA